MDITHQTETLKLRKLIADTQLIFKTGPTEQEIKQDPP